MEFGLVYSLLVFLNCPLHANTKPWAQYCFCFYYGYRLLHGEALPRVKSDSLGCCCGLAAAGISLPWATGPGACYKDMRWHRVNKWLISQALLSETLRLAWQTSQAQSLLVLTADSTSYQKGRREEDKEACPKGDAESASTCPRIVHWMEKCLSLGFQKIQWWIF